MQAARDTAGSHTAAEGEHSAKAVQTKTSKSIDCKAEVSNAQPLPAEKLLFNSDLSLSGLNDSDSWQQYETIPEFLDRLPVLDHATALEGFRPWLWVRCSGDLQHRNQDGDLDAFMAAGTSLLESNGARLQKDLLNAATDCKLTSGKWLLYPNMNDLPRVWGLVAEATASGKLGPTSKVATYDERNPAKNRVICVYTYDFSDLTDVKRVLSALVENEIIKQESRISYKCDAYTHLGIFAGNKYKLQASLYSSDEVHKDKVTYTAGVIAVRKTKNRATMDNYLVPK